MVCCFSLENQLLFIDKDNMYNYEKKLQVNELVQVAAKCRSNNELKETEGVPAQDLLSDCNRLILDPWVFSTLFPCILGPGTR